MRKVKTISWPAPLAGWVQSGKILGAKADQADVLDDFFPTAQGAELRRGLSRQATITGGAKRFLVRRGASDQLFVSTASTICDVTNPADGLVAETPIITGLTSGEWAGAQMSTSGGVFLVAANGSDHALYYDGTDWQPITGEAVNDLAYDALTADFAVGETVTGGTSGATAEILAIMPTSATAGTLKVGAITGTFSDDEALTSASGGATSDIPSGTSAASSIAITGVETAALSYPWVFKERLFFVEGDTSSVWYLDVNAIGGAASEIDLAAVFKRGGNVLFGATWSLDAGDGLDDVCVFVSSEGEVAVYQGTDPNSASTWGLVGVYEMAPPLDKFSSFRAGGDLAIMTEDGIVSVASAMKKDRAALTADAMSARIEDEWRRAVLRRDALWPINATLWQGGAMLLIGIPPSLDGVPQAFVANARTGAWARFRGWDVRCSAVSQNKLYIATDDGDVYQAYVGGTDDGTQYTGVWIPKAQSGGSPSIKSAVNLGLTARAAGTFEWSAAAFGGYEVGPMAAPSPLSPAGDSVWGTAIWGASIWGGQTEAEAVTKWEDVAGEGIAIAPGVAVTSNDTEAPKFHLVAAYLRHEEGSEL